MSDASAELALALAVGSDNERDYLKTSLRAALNTIDALFNATTGHTHSGAHQGGPVGAGGIGALSVVTGSIADGAVTAIKIANRTRSAFVPAGAFQVVSGSPTFSTAGTNGAGHWLLDQTATEEVASGWMLPMDGIAGPVAVFVYLAPVTGGSVGNREVDIELSSASPSAGNLVTGGSDVSTFTTDGTSNTLSIHQHIRAPSLSPGGFLGFSITRRGGNATDDLGTDLKFFGVRIDYTADS